MNDFSTEAVNSFLTFLEERQPGDIEDVLFRELHKLSVVFEVDWLIESCRDWLKRKIDSATDDKDKRFIFDESYFVFDKWGDKCLLGTCHVLCI